MTTLLRYTMTVSALLFLLIDAPSVPAQLVGARISPQGTCHVVALFAKFAGEDPGQTTPPAYADTLFDPDIIGSFSHFYHEMSLGKFMVRGEVPPKYYTSHRPASEYRIHKDDTKGYFGTFNWEVLEKADQDVDFGRFDNDGSDGVPNSGDDDGYVDFLFILVKSNPRGFLPGSASGIATLGLKDDFVTNDTGPSGYIKITPGRGAVQRVWNYPSAVGIMAHEFGHALGLPDLYDRFYDDPEDDSAGIGKWGLMGHGALGWDTDDGPVSFCAWSREQLRWADVVEITEDVVGQVLTDVATTGTVYKIPLSEERAYYLLENRESAKSYYDRHIPRDGLLIWHIRSQVRDARDPNADERHKLVDLVCADGLYVDRGYPDGTQPAPDSGRDNLDFWAGLKYGPYRNDHTGNMGDSTDVFDGIRFTAFTPTTNPESQGGVWIEHIRRRGTDLIADIRPQKWLGPIAGDVTWEGTVHVVGDIVVQEGVTLTIHSGAVVRFSPSDALRSGADPERCEIEVRGTLTITTMGNADPVRFTTEGKGTWTGIRLDERTAFLNWSNPEILVEDCPHPLGIFWSEHPDAARPELFRYLVQDTGETGNGDGALDPGESVELVLDIRNWTRGRFRVAFSTEDPFVLHLEKVPFGTLIPGRTEHTAALLTVDPNCPADHRISCSVTFVDFKSGAAWTDMFSLPVHGPRRDSPVTGIEENDPSDRLPISFALAQNVPNPFNAETTISFELPRPTDLTLTIFNAVGQTIKQWQKSCSAGHHNLTWNGQDEDGAPVASGVYFYRFQAEHFTQTHAATLLR